LTLALIIYFILAILWENENNTQQILEGRVKTNFSNQDKENKEKINLQK
jgi:hypothetical protein